MKRTRKYFALRLLSAGVVAGVLAPAWAQQALPEQDLPPSVEEELSPKPELGDRTLDSLSPEAREVLRKRLIANSNRPMPEVPRETKQQIFQQMAAASPMSMREMFNYMTTKKKVKEGISFDEVIESMDLKANDVNFKKVAHNKFWKDVSAITGLPTTRVEILQYCDAVVGRRMLDYSPEFSVFIPCRITVFEDATGDIWLMTLDWDVTWLARAWQPGSQLSPQLQEDARRIRDAMEQIMEAGANAAW